MSLVERTVHVACITLIVLAPVTAAGVTWSATADSSTALRVIACVVAGVVSLWVLALAFGVIGGLLTRRS